jgi:hypothetical protein
VLGRTVVLRGSSGCLNTGSCSFLLVGARETGELVLPSKLVGVGARESRELVLSASSSLQNRGCSLIMSWCSYV